MSTANRLVVTTPSAARTRALGRRIARLLRAGDVLLLQGPLGAGKTTFAQGIGSGLGVTDGVRSPTFVLLAAHEARAGGLPLYHADLYRLGDPNEVAELALEAQATDGVLLVEWPERGIEVLPPSHLLVRLEPAPGDISARRITLVGTGERYRAILDALLAAGVADRV